VTSTITATHSCRCIESIAPHVLNTLDRPVCKASLRRSHSPATFRTSTSNTTTRYRLGLSFFVFSSSWLPRGPANLHRAVVPRLSPLFQCPSPYHPIGRSTILSNTPKHEDLLATTFPPVHWEVSPLPLAYTIESSTARQGMPVHPSIHKGTLSASVLLV
jgi:hypothetical protein